MKVVTILLQLVGLYLILCQSILDPLITTNEYIEIIKMYCKSRNINILTHFSCYSNAQNVHILRTLSEHNISSRMINQLLNIQYLIDTPQTTIQGFVVSVNCYNFQEIFKQEDHGILFKNNNFWLLLDSSTDNMIESINLTIPMNIRKWLEQLNILPISEVIFARRQNKGGNWILFDVYKIATNSSLEITVCATISAINERQSVCSGKHMSNGSTLQLSERSHRKSTRLNLKGIFLNCGLVIAYPERFTYFEDPAVDHVDIFTKATLPVVETLKEDLNYKCNIVQTDSYGWKINGTWDGVMKLFQHKKINVLSHGTNMRSDRLEYIEFTAEIFAISTPIVFRQPPLSAVSNIFVLPLDIEVWRYASIALVIIVIIMLFQLMHPVLRDHMQAFDVVTMVWGAVCQQGTHLVIPTTSGRVVVLTTFLATLAIFTSYSASIVAILQSPSHSVNNINDLLASPLQLSILEAGYARFNFMKENISILRKVYNEKVKPRGKDGWMYNESLGIEKVRTELFAFLIESVSAYKIIAKRFTENEKCSLSEIHLLKLPMTTMTVERNSGYKELFKQRLRRHREVGLIDRVKKRWLRTKPICNGGSRGFVTVGLREVKPAFNLLTFGYLISLLVLLGEILYHYFIKRCFITGA